ncbi:MAG: bifunctional folylpolyglutamate synthase/dihydrofolate synthase [Syntrophobacterales bacterium]|nr:bifunctional folylpolyglutamate synthase/dihydrofolate synthase [Syntrophobacterales bacterium]
MTYTESLSYLKALNPMGIRLGLEQIKALLERLGNPQDACPAVIIAGTNGKGSVAAMTASMLSAAGFRTGLYTSPDLIEFRERIRIDGEMISQQAAVACLQTVKKSVVETVSYFEFITAMAFLYFQRQKIDIAVLEVGMGGRQDATNVINPLVSVITNISREHEEYLGSTLEQIACEKGGVIKSGGICLTAARQPSVLKVLAGICQEKNAGLYRLGKEFRTILKGDGAFSYRGIRKNYKGLTCPFTGAHQLANAALALGVIEMVGEVNAGFAVPEEAVRRGLGDAKWEGRLEVLGRSPEVVVDGAHNSAGVATLCRALVNDFHYRKLILVFGVLGDKNYRMMAKRLFPLADRIIITRPPCERALDLEAFLPVASEFGENIEVIQSPGEALRQAFFLARKEDLICVAGSLYLVGEIKKMYQGKQS